jgi:hypothetical protein
MTVVLFSVVDAIMRMGTCILPGALAQLEDAYFYDQLLAAT